VLELTPDFACPELLVQPMRLNRFNRRGFSSCPACREAVKRR
jgi:hypothetical protein